MPRSQQSLEIGEVVLKAAGAGYQIGRNGGKLYLTNHRLIWERSFAVMPLTFLFGTKILGIPLVEVIDCERRGALVIVNALAGKFYFYILGPWWTLWMGAAKAKEWLPAIEQAVAAERERQQVEGLAS